VPGSAAAGGNDAATETIRFRLNGCEKTVRTHPVARLLDLLRDTVGDISVKEGCGEGECGACSVLVDGRIVNSCLVPASQVDGREITTMAGLRDTDHGRVLIDAFAEAGAVQCGFCIPGMVMAAEALLRGNPTPSREEIRAGISGNLCRCTGYDLIVEAIAVAARKGAGLW
jgi:carbon-monoxide dehydrogenase small subunit